MGRRQFPQIRHRRNRRPRAWSASPPPPSRPPTSPITGKSPPPNRWSAPSTAKRRSPRCRFSTLATSAAAPTSSCRTAATTAARSASSPPCAAPAAAPTPQTPSARCARSPPITPKWCSPASTWGAGGATSTAARASPPCCAACSDETPVRKLRISSVEPMDWTEELIALIAQSPRIARHVHMPLQSAADAVLKRMRRRYRARHYEQRLLAVREALPDAAIGADVMVGFPGETDADFAQTRDFHRPPAVHLPARVPLLAARRNRGRGACRASPRRRQKRAQPHPARDDRRQKPGLPPALPRTRTLRRLAAPAQRPRPGRSPTTSSPSSWTRPIRLPAACCKRASIRSTPRAP